jgi:hypothetical protein
VKRAAVFVAGALFVPALLLAGHLFPAQLTAVLIVGVMLLVCGMLGSVAMWTYDEWLNIRGQQ